MQAPDTLRSRARLTNDEQWAEEVGVAHPSLPHLCDGTPSTPFEPERPSGIPAAMIFDHVALVSTGFPASNGGRGPRRSGEVRSRARHTSTSAL